MFLKKFDDIRSRKVWNGLKGHYSILLRSLMIVVLLSVSVPYSASSQDGMPPQPDYSALWPNVIVDGAAFFQNMTDRSFRFRQDGVPCVAYGGDHLYYSCFNGTTLGWDTTIVDSDPAVGEYASLVFDNYGNPWIAYYDAFHGWLRVAYKWGISPWTIMVVDVPDILAADTPVEGLGSGLPDDELGQFGKDRPFRETYGIPSADPNAPTVTNNAIGVGKHTSIDIDVDNIVHVSYYDEQYGALMYAKWDGINPWQFYKLHDYSDNGDTGLWTSLEVDGFRQAHIAYKNAKYDDLYYAAVSPDATKVKIIPVDTDGKVGSFASLALDVNGRPHISYLEFGQSSYRLKYAKLNNDNTTWTKTTVDQSNSGLYSSIFVRGTTPYISYYHVTDGNLRYAKPAGNGWNITSPVTLGDVGYFTSIALNALGIPGIAFYNASTGAYQFIKWDDVTNKWVSYPVISYSGDIGLSTSLAINSFGKPYILYQHDSFNYMKFAHAIGAYWSKSFITTLFHAGAFSDVTLAGDYSPRIAFYNEDTHDLMYGVYNAGQWFLSYVDTKGDTGMYPSLALDNSGIPHISYYNATKRDLMYATWNIVTSKWVTHTVEYWDDDVGLFTSIDWHPTTGPVISYYDATYHRLKYAYRSPTLVWIKEVVDQDIDVGQFASMEQDSAGYPHIAYYDAYYKRLLYAYKDIAGWHYETIHDNPPETAGQYASLTLDAFDNAYVSYYEGTNQDLWFAYRSGGVWFPSQVDVFGDVGRFSSIDSFQAFGFTWLGISYYDGTLGELRYASYWLPYGSTFLPLLFGP